MALREEPARMEVLSALTAPHRPGSSPADGYVLLALCAAGTVLILVWLSGYGGYGFDFTDEGFYLAWLANPSLYDWSLTQFGFIYHPLYIWLDGDIVSLRRANILITFGLAWVLAWLVLRMPLPDTAGRGFATAIPAAALAVSSLVVFDFWLPTPSYNSLALQALLIYAAGLLLAHKGAWAGVLIGLGGWLAFMAKPSTALVLALGTLLYLAAARRLGGRLLLVSVGSALVLLVVSAWWIDGALPKFADRLRLGVQFASYLGGGHTLAESLRLDELPLGGREKAAIALFAASALLATWLLGSGKQIRRLIGLVISAFFLLIILLFSLGIVTGTAGLGAFQRLVLWGAVLPILWLGLTAPRPGEALAAAAPRWHLALLFLFLPYFFAFGANGNYWQLQGGAAYFWLLAAFVLAGPRARAGHGWVFAIPILMAGQAITATLLQTGLEQPYRQPQPLRLNDRTVAVGAAGTRLVLSSGFAGYIETAMKAAHASGYRSGTPIIDLTGQSPGLLYALGAGNVGLAWTIGGYPGSVRFVGAAWGRVPCATLASAWLLHEPDGPRAIPRETVAAFGATPDAHYVPAASWWTAAGAGGYPTPRRQRLDRPSRPQDVLIACQALRGGKAP